MYHLILFLLLSISLLVNSFHPYMSQNVYISVFIVGLIAIARYGMDKDSYKNRKMNALRKIAKEAESIDKKYTLVFQGYFENELGFKINLLPEYKDLVFKSALDERIVLSTNNMELIEKLKTTLNKKVNVYFYKGIIVDVEVVEETKSNIESQKDASVTE